MLIQATPGRLKVHVDKKLDNNNVQLQTIYVMVNSRSFKDLCNEIKGLSSTYPLYKYFQGLEIFLNFKYFQGCMGTLI